MPEGKGTLCWTCQRATNRPGMGCSWSRRKNPRPVEGWTATRRDIGIQGQESQLAESYLVHACPLYLADPPRKAPPSVLLGPDVEKPHGLYAFRGRMLTIREIAAECIVDENTIRYRMKRGMTLEEAVSTPVQEKYSRNIHPLTINGRTMSIAAWARISGIKEGTIRYRLQNGKKGEALIAPVKPNMERGRKA